MSEIRFTENHEWMRIDEGVGIVGVTDHAQDKMGDVTFALAPTVGIPLDQGEFVCVLETVDTSMEVCAPIGGEIAEVNGMLEQHPEMINSNPMGDGSIFKLQKIYKSQFKKLMDIGEYEEFLAGDVERAEERSVSHIFLDDVVVEDDEDEDY